MRRRQLVTATLIAAFLAFHLTAITLRALPSPEPALDRNAWKDPSVQRELDAWARRIEPFGVHWTGLEFAEHGVVLLQHYLNLRNKILDPFIPYFEYVGVTQAWSMFQAPHRHPARLRIDVEQNGQWQTVFRERDPRYTWKAEQLSDTRFRSVIFRIGWPNYRGELERFSDWIGKEAARDFPYATRSRVVMERAETPSPEQVRAHAPVKIDDDPAQVRLLGGLR